MAQNSVVQPALKTPSTEVVKGFACLTCRQRKIKCDQHNPCAHCIKVSTECKFIAPVRGKRKRTKAPKEGLHAKLKRYEQLLKSYGAKIEPSEDEESSDEETCSRFDSDKASPSSASKDRSGLYQESKSNIIHKDGSSRYFENTLWSRIGQELDRQDEQALVDVIREGIGADTLTGGCMGGIAPRAAAFNLRSDPMESEEHGLLLGVCSEVQNLASLHPPLGTVTKLWTIFLERVDPLIKLLHAPTFWSTLKNVLQNPYNVSKSVEALVFAFYTSVLSSMEDDECQRLLGDQKPNLIAKYRAGCRQALINAAFIKTSSLMTLQAYVLFLLGTRGILQSDTFYVLSGVAVRLARRMGVHRDGTFLGLSVFETEMRRRLWWQIVHVDSRSSDFSGTRPSMDLTLSDTKRALNVLDEDLTPEMTSPPPERLGITPCVLTIIRCDLIGSLRKFGPRSSYDTHWEKLTSSYLTVEEKDKLISEIEELLETKYIRYCDPSLPLHFFTSILARSALCKLRLFAHNPRQFADRGIKMPQADRDIIWANGLKLLEYGNVLHATAALRPLTWQVGTAYLWDTLLYVLIEARGRRRGPAVDRAWTLIAAVFNNYPHVFHGASDALFDALGAWTLQVWDDCAAARRDAHEPQVREPDFIAAIRRGRKPQAQALAEEVGAKAGGNAAAAGKAAAGDAGQALWVEEGPAAEVDAIETYDFSNLLSFDLEPSEWEQWERLLAGQGV